VLRARNGACLLLCEFIAYTRMMKGAATVD
jgi:hypothetical protein